MLRLSHFNVVFFAWILSLWAWSGGVAAASLDPRQEAVRFEVKDIALEGFRFESHEAMDVGQVKEQLKIVRAKYGLLMTVDELNQLADGLTLYVRSKGFPFHSVYLPPQQVVNGQVLLMMQEGVLADVKVINNTGIADERFSLPFAELVGKLLYAPAVEHQVFALKAQAGFKVFAFYSRGQQPGEARLNLRLEPASKRVTSLRFDNYGSRASGRYRAVGQWQEHQVSGHFDELSLAILQTLDEVSNTYGSLVYQRPFAALDFVWDLSLSNNQFEVGANFAPLQLAGTATHISTGLTRYLNWQDGQRHWWGFTAFDKSSEVTSDFLQALGQEETSRGVTLGWNREWGWGRTGLATGVNLTYGRYTRTPQLKEAETFSKLEYNLALGQPASDGRWGLRPSLALRGQWSRDSLPSIESVSLTGAYGVRAMEAGMFAADRGWVVSGELALPQLLPQDQAWRIEPFLSADAAMGEKLDAQGNSLMDATFSGFGMGLRGYWGNHVDAKLSAAVPVAGDINGVDVPDSGVVLFEFRIH